MLFKERDIPLIQRYSQLFLDISSLEESLVVYVSIAAQMERDPGSWELELTIKVTIKVSAYSPAPGKGFPNISVIALPQHGRLFPAKLLQLHSPLFQQSVTALLRSWDVLQLYSGPPEYNNSAGLGASFPKESVTVYFGLVCSGTRGSCYSWTPLQWKSHTVQQTSLRRFIGKEESRRVAAPRVRSSSRANWVQSLYRVSLCVCVWGGVLSREAWDWWIFVAWFWGKLRDWWDFMLRTSVIGGTLCSGIGGIL